MPLEDHWSRGYYTQDGYTFGFYPETMPFRLWLTALTHGHEARKSNFRYLDLGCGQGYNTILAAISHPDSEFIGVDFMPRHVTHGNRLVEKLGLKNVRFYENDFASVPKQPWTSEGFDYIVSHGVCSWISPKSRDDLFSAISYLLRSQGVLYISYNTMPGWLPMLPFQRMVHDYRATLGGDGAIKHARELVERFSTIPGSYLSALPSALASTKATSQHDLAYLKQEYANEYWIPFWSSDIINELSAAKLDFLGTANLSEVFEQYYPSEFTSLFQLEPDRARREQLKDLSFNQAFRRDLFVRGKSQLWMGENLAAIGDLVVIANPLAALPEEGKPFIFKAGTIEIKGDRTAYKAFLDLIEQSSPGTTIAELAIKSGRNRLESSHMAILLYAGGWVYLSTNKPNLNFDTNLKSIVRDISNHVAQGAGYRFIPTPSVHSALLFSEFDITLINYLLTLGGEFNASNVLKDLLRNGRVIREKGEVLNDEVSQKRLIQAEINSLVGRLDKLAEFRVFNIRPE